MHEHALCRHQNTARQDIDAFGYTVVQGDIEYKCLCVASCALARVWSVSWLLEDTNPPFMLIYTTVCIAYVSLHHVCDGHYFSAASVTSFRLVFEDSAVCVCSYSMPVQQHMAQSSCTVIQLVSGRHFKVKLPCCALFVTVIAGRGPVLKVLLLQPYTPAAAACRLLTLGERALPAQCTMACHSLCSPLGSLCMACLDTAMPQVTRLVRHILHGCQLQV